jgi:uncharacterized protein (TIGR02246 family)
MICRSHVALCAGLLAALWAGNAIGQTKAQTPGDQNTKQVAEVRAAAQELLSAKQRGDWQKAAELWTPDGLYIDSSGQSFTASELLKRQSTAESDQGRPLVVGTEESVRFVTPEVAIVDGSQPLGVSSDGAVESLRFTAVWVRRDGRWLLDSLREAVATSPAPHDQLEALAWLVGEWTSSTSNTDIILSTHWNASGAYLLRDFLVRSAEGDLVSGTQRIGWDPAARAIESWTFDSAGGTAEARWEQADSKWITKGQETLPDGAVVDTTTTYVPEGADRIEVTIERVKGEAKLPTLKLDFRRARAETDDR